MFKNKILYFGNSIGIPTSAAAIHVSNRSKLFYKLNYEMHIVCNKEKNQTEIMYDDLLNYHYIPQIKGNGKIRALRWFLDVLFGFHSYKYLKKYIDIIQPNIIILYNLYSIRMENKLRKLCKKNNISIIIETTEWRENEKEVRLIDNIINSFTNFKINHIDKKCKNLIVISDFLANHYLNQNCNIICLPPIFPNLIDRDEVVKINKSKTNSMIKLVFAGSLARKDFLNEIIHAILIINSDGIKILFDIIGPTNDDLSKLLDIDNYEKYGIYVHGKMSHDKALNCVKNSDFSVLLRQDKKYAKAGVSTKFCEAMKLGVPSICTKVGGTDLFVKHGLNGFLIDNNSLEEIMKILQYILTLSNDEILNMKLNAYDFACKEFSEDKYLVKVNEFLYKCNN